jgi:hypothetical protein
LGTTAYPEGHTRRRDNGVCSPGQAFFYARPTAAKQLPAQDTFAALKSQVMLRAAGATT